MLSRPGPCANNSTGLRVSLGIRGLGPAIPDPTVDQFTKIFELNCVKRDLRFHQVMVAYLQRRHYGPLRRPLRACHPRDLLEHVTAMCRYRGIEPVITRELLDAACASYFVDTAKTVAAVPPLRGAAPQRQKVQ